MSDLPVSSSKIWRQNFVAKWPSWSVKAKKQILLQKVDTSAFSAGLDDSHILFFEPFMHSHIILDINGKIRVTVGTFAAAYNEFDLGNCAKILCKEVFTPEELATRNASNNILVLPIFKTDAIKRACLWMVDKQKNAWDYTPSNSQIFLTSDQEAAINLSFQTFSVVCAPIYKPEEDLNSEKARIREPENNYFLKEFRRIIDEIKSGSAEPLGNLAQMVENLTIIALEERLEDIFVGPVQFSKRRWTKALQADGICNRAEVLFRKSLYMDYTSKGKLFPGFAQFCPVRKLSIIQAVAFLRSEICVKYKKKFDSSIPEHNMFLNENEVKEIAEFIDSKYVTSPCNMDLIEIIDSNSINWIDFPQIENLPSTSNALVAFQPSNVQQLQTLHIQNFPTQTSVEDRRAQLLASIPKDPITGNYIFGGESFTPAQWKDTVTKSEGGEEIVKAGKNLFKLSYEGQELNFSKSGRVGTNGQKTEKLPESKVNDILEALCYVQAVTGDGILKPWSKLEREALTNKIFVDYRNSLQAKKRKAT